MYENLKKMSIKAKGMLKNANSFLEVCLMELDQSKIINSVPDRILHNCPKPFSQRYCVAINCARRFKSTGIGIEIWHRYHRYRIDTIDIVSVSYRFKKAGIAHPYLSGVCALIHNFKIFYFQYNKLTWCFHKI